MKNLFYSLERLTCSREEKIECLETMRKLSNFMIVGRREGFLALEYFWEEETNPLIKACLMDIMDGLDSGQLEQCFRGYLEEGNYRGKEFLQAIIIFRGFLLMQACHLPEVLWDEMQDFFGEDFSLEYGEAFRLAKKNKEIICREEKL